MHSLAEFWLMLTDIILKNFLACLRLSTDQGDSSGCSKTWMQPLSLQGWTGLQVWFQASPLALYLGTPLDFLLKMLLPSSGGSLQEDVWWMVMGGEAEHYERAFFRHVNCAITTTLKSNFKVAAFPLISVSETVLFTAHAQHLSLLFFLGFCFKTDRSLTKVV